MMQIVLDFLTTWLFNGMQVAAAIWVILRMVEKFWDIALKVQGYQIRRRTDKWDREHERRAEG